MKAIQFQARGGPEVVVYADAPSPRPGEGEVLIRVHAAAVTPTEFFWFSTSKTRTGTPRPLPVIPGHEFSGEVVALGAGVNEVSVGELVYGLTDWFRDGVQAEYSVARVAEFARKPPGVDHLQAAVAPISALTAWQGLFERARLTAGQHVLIHGAAGAVGVFAVQLARWRGARVTGTVSAANLDFVRGLGADDVIDYRAQRFENVVRDIDVVFDGVGGETLERSWGVLKPGGTLITIASSSENATDERTRAAFFIVETSKPQLEEVARLIDSGALHPIVDSVFPLAEARQAYQHKPLRGKVALQVIAAG
jgi:NADPH:quinone reductase-like Zn-dependent oxidoreductase